MKSRFSHEQIVAILNQNKAGAPVNKLCAEYRISKSTFYNWRDKLQFASASSGPTNPAVDAAKAEQAAAS